MTQPIALLLAAILVLQPLSDAAAQAFQAPGGAGIGTPLIPAPVASGWSVLNLPTPRAANLPYGMTDTQYFRAVGLLDRFEALKDARGPWAYRLEQAGYTPEALAERLRTDPVKALVDLEQTWAEAAAALESAAKAEFDPAIPYKELARHKAYLTLATADAVAARAAPKLPKLPEQVRAQTQDWGTPGMPSTDFDAGPGLQIFVKGMPGVEVSKPGDFDEVGDLTATVNGETVQVRRPASGWKTLPALNVGELPYGLSDREYFLGAGLLEKYNKLDLSDRGLVAFELEDAGYTPESFRAMLKDDPMRAIEDLQRAWNAAAATAPDGPDMWIGSVEDRATSGLKPVRGPSTAAEPGKPYSGSLKKLFGLGSAAVAMLALPTFASAAGFTLPADALMEQAFLKGALVGGSLAALPVVVSARTPRSPEPAIGAVFAAGLTLLAFGAGALAGGMAGLSILVFGFRVTLAAVAVSAQLYSFYRARAKSAGRLSSTLSAAAALLALPTVASAAGGLPFTGWDIVGGAAAGALLGAFAAWKQTQEDRKRAGSSLVPFGREMAAVLNFLVFVPIGTVLGTAIGAFIGLFR